MSTAAPRAVLVARYPIRAAADLEELRRIGERMRNDVCTLVRRDTLGPVPL